jgi:hypothetical protein
VKQGVGGWRGVGGNIQIDHQHSIGRASQLVEGTDSGSGNGHFELTC